jgi:hypothetical protein
MAVNAFMTITSRKLPMNAIKSKAGLHQVDKQMAVTIRA